MQQSLSTVKKYETFSHWNLGLDKEVGEIFICERLQMNLYVFYHEVYE